MVTTYGKATKSFLHGQKIKITLTFFILPTYVLYESLEGPLLKKKKKSRYNEITNS